VPPGYSSIQRHWRSQDGEFVCVPERDVPLIEDGAETARRAGDCGHFAKGAATAAFQVASQATANKAR
jgi:uncharacterized cupin superfamily protein